MAPSVCTGMGFFNKSFSTSFLGAVLALSLLFVFSCSEDKSQNIKFTLSIVEPQGGTLTSGSGGINCGSGGDICKVNLDKDSEVTLTAAADKGYKLGDWGGGDCSGSGNTCKLRMDTNKSVTKAFNRPGEKTLTIVITREEGGRVISKSGDIDCGDSKTICTAPFTNGTRVTLTAKPNLGYATGVWTGAACSGDGPCTLSMDTDKTVGLEFFAPPAAPELMALAGDARISLSWTQGDDGGSDITKHQYRVSADGGMSWNPDWTNITDSAPGETNATSFTVAGLTNGMAYTFEIRAVNSVGNGTSSQVSATPEATVPDAPDDLRATAGDTEVSLSWKLGDDGGSDITKHQYRVSADGGRNWNPDWTDILNSAPGETNATSFTVTGLANGTAYTFEIRAVNSVGNGTSSQVSATPEATVPGAPDDLRATAGNTQVSLSWKLGDDGGSDITKHQYRVSADGGRNWNPDWTDILNSAHGETNATSFIVTGLANGTAYTFEMRAVNSVGNGTSSQVSATPKRATIPGVPKKLTALKRHGRVTLSWKLGDDGGSEIIGHYRAVINHSDPRPARPRWLYIPNSAPGEANAESFMFIGLTNGVLYTFMIRAKNSVGDGAVSQVSATPRGLAVPSAPDDFIAFAGNIRVLLSWGQVDDGGTDIIKYQYRVSADGGTNWNPGWTDIADSAHGKTNAESFMVTGLANGTTYTFEIRAVNSSPYGTGPSSQASATPESTSMAVLPKAAEAHVDTKGGMIRDEPKIPATLKLVGEDGLTMFQGHIGIELRGSTSQTFPKKSYGFETWDKDGNDIDVALAGFPEEEDWIFYGPYSDKSLIRNALMYELSNDIGQYASKTKFFDLYINGDFLGCYVLMEKPKRDKNRINVSKKGFVLKLDKQTGDAGISPESLIHSKFNSLGVLHPDILSRRDVLFLSDYPDPDDITKEQAKPIRDYMDNFEEALFGARFDKKKGGYSKYIDTASFIDYFLLNEFSRDNDAFRLSTYMHKEENGKLKMGPIWDFNIALGNADYCGGDNSKGWAHLHPKDCRPMVEPEHAVPHWWERLLEDPNWVTQLKTRWTSLRSGTFATAAIQKKIDDKVRFLKERKIPSRNFKKWGTLGIKVWPNSFVGKTYREEIDYLKDWISKRLTWMDKAINKL